MLILISFFAISFLGVVSMLAYKLMVLERQGMAGTHPSFSSSSAAAFQAPGSLDRRFGVFFRTYAKRFSLTVAYVWSHLFLPVFLRSMQIFIAVMVRIIKKIRSLISSRINSFGNRGESRKGAVSFFLKHISEHKKNLKNGTGH